MKTLLTRIKIGYWVNALHLAWYKTGHFRDVLPCQSIGLA